MAKTGPRFPWFAPTTSKPRSQRALPLLANCRQTTGSNSRAFDPKYDRLSFRLENCWWKVTGITHVPDIGPTFHNGYSELSPFRTFGKVARNISPFEHSIEADKLNDFVKVSPENCWRTMESISPGFESDICRLEHQNLPKLYRQIGSISPFFAPNMFPALRLHSKFASWKVRALPQIIAGERGGLSEHVTLLCFQTALANAIRRNLPPPPAENAREKQAEFPTFTEVGDIEMPHKIFRGKIALHHLEAIPSTIFHELTGWSWCGRSPPASTPHIPIQAQIFFCAKGVGKRPSLLRSLSSGRARQKSNLVTTTREPVHADHSYTRFLFE